MRLDVGRASAGQAGLYGRREYFVGVAAGRSEIDGGLRRSEHQRDGRRRAGRQGLRQALPEALSFDYRGGTKTIAVSSNFEWNHAADAKWFAVTRENDVLTVTVDPYDGEQGRTENISLTTGVGENTASLEVAITQMGVNDKYLRWKFEIPSDNATATAMIARRGRCRDQLGRRYGRDRHDGESDARLRYGRQLRRGGERKVTALKSAGEKSYVVEVLQWGQTGLTSMEDAFNGCMNLKSIPSDTAHSFDGVTTFNEAFYDCQTLGAIPAGLFDTLPGRPTSPRRSISATAYRRFPKNSSTTIPKRLRSARPSIMWVRR